MTAETITEPPIAAAPHPPEQLTFGYTPRKGLLRLTVVNFLLGIVTLGIYRFWAKTNVRRHIWSCVHINGEPLEYTGRGIELFKGFLMVLLVLVLPIAIITAAIFLIEGSESPKLIVVQMLLLIFVYVFWGYAVYKARSYQLSRTNWRGIRGALTGSAMIYSLLYFGALLAKSMSFGWATPVMNTVLQEQITNDMRFGDAAFKFKGRAGPLYPTYALCWFLTLGAIIAIIVLAVGAGAGLFSESVGAAFEHVFGDNATATEWEYGVVGLVILAILAFILIFSLVIPMLWAVYIAKELRTFANYTRFDGAQFQLRASAGSVIWLTIVNLLILIFTLGIGWPYINQRVVRFVVDRISLDGAIDIDRIRQSQVPLAKRGEGLADAFDVGGL
ncbi:MAG: DUF898 domain-containing protein [Proteobacteria bacterium]|nr:DUF898 domain-containing protein [Pseudomonadota bacterium]